MEHFPSTYPQEDQKKESFLKQAIEAIKEKADFVMHSPFFRIALAAMVLSGSSMKKTEARHESQTKDQFELMVHPEVHDKFDAFYQLEGENYLLHISQLHHTLSYELTQQTGKSEAIVAVQKDIEKLLLSLQQQGDERLEVFVEGFGVNNPFWDTIDEIQEKIETTRKEVGIKGTLEVCKQAYIDLQSNFDEWQKTGADAYVAYALYTIAHELKTELDSYSDVKRKHEVGESLSEESKGIFEDSKYVEELTNLYSEVANHKLIQGENVYLWGAAEKLHIEKKVFLAPAEDNELQSMFFKQKEKSSESNSVDAYYKQVIDTMNENPDEFAAFQETREDTALNIAYNKKKIIPIVYGCDHDFENNIKNFNSRNNTKLGLVTIESKLLTQEKE